MSAYINNCRYAIKIGLNKLWLMAVVMQIKIGLKQFWVLTAVDVQIKIGFKQLMVLTLITWYAD